MTALPPWREVAVPRPDIPMAHSTRRASPPILGSLTPVTDGWSIEIPASSMSRPTSRRTLQSCSKS